MIKRELAQDPSLKNENWDRFLPHFKKKNLSKRRKPHHTTDKSKKVYTPFPPAPEKSKIDKQLETGEYFLSKQVKERAQKEKREEGRREKRAEKMKERDKDFVPPTEDGDRDRKGRKKRKREGEEGQGKEKKEKEKGEKKEKKEKKRRTMELEVR